MAETAPGSAELVAEAKRRLGIDDLVLIIHDRSFPSDAACDVGFGTPNGHGGRRFLAFARRLGFTGIQLGPAGLTSRDDPSPYDGTVFSRSPLAIDFFALAEDPLFAWLEPQRSGELLAAQRPDGPADRIAYAYAWDAYDRELSALHQAFTRRRSSPEAHILLAELARYRDEHSAWLSSDALYDVLCRLHRAGDFTHWRHSDAELFPAAGSRYDALLQAHGQELEAYAMWQLAADRQYQKTAEAARALGLELLGDFQVGYARRDVWRWRGAFLSDYAMGAPPSRTNPEGQPWGYPVLDPDLYGTGLAPGPARQLLVMRVERMLASYDRLRLDHPHGFVCPWVYRLAAPDPLAAVQGGARLFSSPDVAEHPELARYAIVRGEQLDKGQPRHADGWVRSLEAEQVRRYATLVESIIATATRLGRPRGLVCEVLSTQPNELGAVLAEFGLGRFRVTQKANLDDPRDVYRGENATPRDWIMLGNHDTPPLWRLLETWQAQGTVGRRAAYLAERLCPPGGDREALAQKLAQSPEDLAEAQAAELFVGPARHVMIFYADLFGETAIYNRPGTISPDNWSMRLPPDYDAVYEARRRERRALDLRRVLALALEARGLGKDGLAERLRGA